MISLKCNFFICFRPIVTELYYLLADYYFKNKEQVYVQNLFATALTYKTILYFWKITQSDKLFSLLRPRLRIPSASRFVWAAPLQPILPIRMSLTIDIMFFTVTLTNTVTVRLRAHLQVVFYCVSGKPSNTTWTTWPWFRTGSTPGLEWHWPSQANWSRNSILWVHGLFAFIHLAPLYIIFIC